MDLVRLADLLVSHTAKSSRSYRFSVGHPPATQHSFPTVRTCTHKHTLTNHRPDNIQYVLQTFVRYVIAHASVPFFVCVLSSFVLTELPRVCVLACECVCFNLDRHTHTHTNDTRTHMRRMSRVVHVVALEARARELLVGRGFAEKSLGGMLFGACEPFCVRTPSATDAKRRVQMAASDDELGHTQLLIHSGVYGLWRSSA